MLLNAPQVVDVVVPAALHRRTVPGIRLHRRDLAPVDRVGVGGLELTARALLGRGTAWAPTSISVAATTHGRNIPARG